MISCLACEISRRTSVRISCFSVSRSATVTDGDDDASDDCGWDDAVVVDDDDELCREKLSDSCPVNDWNLLLTTQHKNYIRVGKVTCFSGQHKTKKTDWTNSKAQRPYTNSFGACIIGRNRLERKRFKTLEDLIWRRDSCEDVGRGHTKMEKRQQTCWIAGIHWTELNMENTWTEYVKCHKTSAHLWQ